MRNRRTRRRQHSAAVAIGTRNPSNQKAIGAVDLIDHPAEVHAEEAGDECERQEDRRHDADHISPLVQLQIEHHPHRVRSGVDRRQQAVDLISSRSKYGSSEGLEASKRSDFGADTLEDGLFVPDPAPHRREPGTGLAAASPSARLRRPPPSTPGKGVQPQFDLVERVGGGGEHRVEDRIDDVWLAPFLAEGRERGLPAARLARRAASAGSRS